MNAFARLFAAVVFAWLPSQVVFAGLIYIDQFENQPVDTGVGTPLGYFSFGDQMLDRGVSKLLGATSGSRSAFYVIDFSRTGFGVGAAHEGLDLDLSVWSTLSVNARTTVDLGNTGFLGFRLEDADGSVFRTELADLFSVGTGFQPISQSIDLLTFEDAAGTTAGLDRANIVSVGLLFFDQGFSGTATIVFDDLSVSVPEARPWLFFALIVGMATLRWRQLS